MPGPSAKGMTALFWIGIAFTIVAPVAIGLKFGNPAIATLAAACGVAVTFLSRIDTLSKLSLGVVSAEMRETLAEATATIDQLRGVAATSAKVQLTSLMASSFMSGLDLAPRMALRDRLCEELERLGCDQAQIDDALEGWNRGVPVIYHRGIHAILSARAKEADAGEDSQNRLETARRFQDELLDFPNWDVAPPDRMVEFLNERGAMEPEIEGWISDYRHFLETGEIRRRLRFEQL